MKLERWTNNTHIVLRMDMFDVCARVYVHIFSVLAVIVGLNYLPIRK